MPPEQPNPSPYQPPSGPGQVQGPGQGPIPAQAPAGGYGPPVPPQHNPYAQAGPYAPQPGQQPGYYPPPPAAPGAPGGPQGRGGGGRAVLWIAVGALVASALWGGGVLLLGKDDKAKADLRGYALRSNLCDGVDVSAFKTRYAGDASPTAYTAKGAALDQMNCDESLKRSGSDQSDAYVSIEMDLHKKSDPEPEFTDEWLGYKQHKPAYKVEPLSGYGEKAYLVTETSGDGYVTLAVQDGWMTYSMTCAPTVDQGSSWVQTSSKATLAKLKS